MTITKTYAIEYEHKTTGIKTCGVLRYLKQENAIAEAMRLQKDADKIGRPVFIRAVETNDRREA